MEMPPHNSAEETYEYDSSEVLDYSALSSFTDSNFADDEQEEGEPFTLEEGTGSFPQKKNEYALSRQCLSSSARFMLVIVFTHAHWYLNTHTGAGLASYESLYDKLYDKHFLSHLNLLVWRCLMTIFSEQLHGDDHVPYAGIHFY